jgi:hypothetical protein
MKSIVVDVCCATHREFADAFIECERLGVSIYFEGDHAGTRFFWFHHFMKREKAIDGS